MSLSVTSIDVNARVTLATTLDPATGIVWSKSGDGVTFFPFTTTTSGVQSIVDNRPHKNYSRINYSNPGGNLNTLQFEFTGTEIGLYANLYVSGYSIDVNIDETHHTAIVENSGDYPHVHYGGQTSCQNCIVWGISGLSNTTHTVTLTMSGPVGTVYLNQLFNGYSFTDLSISYGCPVTYKIIVDGTTEETIQVTPVVDRIGVFQKQVDLLFDSGIMTDYPTNLTDNSWFERVGFMSSTAGAYLSTGDERLFTLAEAIYDDFVSAWAPYYWESGFSLEQVYSYGLIIDAHAADYNTGYDEDFATLNMNGRVASSFHFAYKAFKDTHPTEALNYLAVADMFVTNFITVWPTSGGIFKATYPDYNTDYTNQPNIPNQMAQVVYGLALLYNEPASTHYHSSTVQTMLLANANVLTTTIDEETGAMYYAGSVVPDMSYAAVTWPILQYISQNWDWRTTETARATSWLNSKPITEPYFYISIFYGYTWPSFIRILTQHTQHGIVSQDFIDMFFSAAFDSNSYGDCLGSDPEYLPQGFDPLAEFQYQWAEGWSWFFRLKYFHNLGLDVLSFPINADVRPASAVGSIAPLMAAFSRYITAEIKSTNAPGSINPLTATYSRYVIAEVKAANAFGSINKLTASVGGLSPFMYSLKGSGGATYPFYIKTQ